MKMKAKAQPCLRDYLTIHVPASTLMGDRDRVKRREKIQDEINPLMNKKLQLNSKDNNVALIYSSLPNKSFGKRKKLETIPLLSNMKMNSEHNLRIVKDNKKTSYDFVFQKNKLTMKPNSKQKYILNRGLTSSKSSKSIPNVRPMSQVIKRNSNHFSSQKFFDSVTPFEYRLQQFSARRIQSSPMMEISGSKARLSLTASYWKRQHRQGAFRSTEENQHDKFDIKIFH